MSEPNPKRQKTSASLNPKLDGVKLENEAMEQLIDENENEFGELFSKLQESANKRNATMKQKNQKMKDNIEEFERQIKEYGRTETSLRSTIEQLDKQRKSMEDILGIMQSTCGENEKKIRDLEEQLASKTKAEAELQNINADLRDISGKIEADHKNALKKIKELNDKHKKEMADMQTKFDNEKDAYEDEISGLKSRNADLSKKFNEEQGYALYLKDNLMLHDTTTKKKEIDFQTRIKELEERDRNSYQTINGQRERIHDLEYELQETKTEFRVRYLTLEQVRDGSTISNDIIMNYCNVTVLKVTRIIQEHGYWNLYSTDNPKENPVIVKIPDFIQNTVLHFEVNGELDLHESDLNLILPRLYSCTLKKLNLHGAIISWDIFKKLTGACFQFRSSIISFKNVVVKSRLGTMLKFDVILNELPCVSEFIMDKIRTPITSEICDSLNCHLPNLRRFTLKPIDASFNLDAFALFIKKNPDAVFYLKYCGLSTYEKDAIDKKMKQLTKICFKIVKFIWNIFKLCM